MPKSSRNTALFVAFALLPGACSLFENDSAPLSTGVYALASYNGQGLPFDLGPEPPKGTNPGGCPILITGGRISIVAETRTFSYSYDIRNGCTNELMSQPGLQGVYEGTGGELTFIVTRADGQVFRHAGTLSSSRIVLDSGDERLTFRR